MTKASGRGGTSICHFIHWRLLGPQAYQLSWDIPHLDYLGINQIFLSVIAADLFGDPLRKIANFSLGGITIGYLQTDKLYKVRLEAFKGKVSVWLYSGKIRTLPIGKPVPVIMNAFLSHGRY